MVMKWNLFMIIISLGLTTFGCQNKNDNIYVNKNYDIIIADDDTLTIYSRICFHPYKIVKFEEDLYKIESNYWGCTMYNDAESFYYVKLLINKDDTSITINSIDSCYTKSKLSKYSSFKKIINTKFDFSWDKLEVALCDEFGNERASGVFEINEIPKYELKKLWVLSQKGFDDVMTANYYPYATFKFYQGNTFKHIVELPMMPCWLNYFNWRNAKFKMIESEFIF